jgi:hypothetical protein
LDARTEYEETRHQHEAKRLTNPFNDRKKSHCLPD